MKKVMYLTAVFLTASALIFTGCKKDEEEPIAPTPSAPAVPQSSAQQLYLPLNNSASASVGSVTVVANTATPTADRFGTANGAMFFDGNATAGTGSIIELSGGNFISPSMTISCWYKLDPTSFGPGSRIMFGLCTERGYFMEVAGDQAWTKLATSHALSPDPNNHYFGTAWTDPNGDGATNDNVLFDYMGSIADLFGGTEWHQMVMTHNAADAVKTIYVDGVKVMQVDLDANTTEWYLKGMGIANQADGTGEAITGLVPNLTLGYFCSPSNTATGWSDYATSTNTWKGAMDDFRIWNVALSQTEVEALYELEN
jgi:hypothetical protein